MQPSVTLPNPTAGYGHRRRKDEQKQARGHILTPFAVLLMVP